MDFAVPLSQHHAQTLTMAEMARSKARSAEVEAVADGISPDARQPAEQVLDTQRAQMAEVARARDTD